MGQANGSMEAAPGAAAGAAAGAWGSHAASSQQETSGQGGVCIPVEARGGHECPSSSGAVGLGF